MVVLTVETDIIASIAVSLSARAVMLVIMYIETIKTDVRYCLYRKCYNVHAVVLIVITPHQNQSLILKISFGEIK